MRTLIVLLALSCTGFAPAKGLWRKHFDKPEQPKKCVKYAKNIPNSPGLIWGDAFGENKAKEVAAQMVKTCPECGWALYLGDIYTWGVNDEEERASKVDWVKKVLHKRLIHVLANHDYYGKPELLVGESYTPCAEFFVENDWLSIQVLDTNWPVSRSWPVCGRFDRLRMIAAHHPLRSATTKNRDADREELREVYNGQIRACADIYAAGHDHSQQLIKKDGLVHLISGAGGRSLTKVKQDYKGLIWGSGDTHGFSVIRHIKKKHYKIEFYSVNGTLLHTSSF